MRIRTGGSGRYDLAMRDPKDIVRDGYDQISLEYRREDFDFETSGYRRFLNEFEPLLKASSRILDLGCGCGIPVARHLAQSHHVTGVDLSEVQVTRARELVPNASFLQADMTELEFEPESFEAIISFYAIIHVPLEQQPALFERISSWLVSGGLLMVTLGHTAWTGTEADWKGAEMYWSHASAETYREWLAGQNLEVIVEHFVPEGDGGHSLFIARKHA
jgi:cyclopropane fatty-acyl-phospholipid synthase-like methyltransferase